MIEEDTPAIKAWKESLAKKLASPKHRMKEAEKQLKLLNDSMPRDLIAEPDDEWGREYKAALQVFASLRGSGRGRVPAIVVRKEDEEQSRRNHPEEIGDQ